MTLSKLDSLFYYQILSVSEHKKSRKSDGVVKSFSLPPLPLLYTVKRRTMNKGKTKIGEKILRKQELEFYELPSSSRSNQNQIRRRRAFQTTILVWFYLFDFECWEPYSFWHLIYLDTHWQVRWMHSSFILYLAFLT